MTREFDQFAHDLPQVLGRRTLSGKTPHNHFLFHMVVKGEVPHIEATKRRPALDSRSFGPVPSRQISTVNRELSPQFDLSTGGGR